ncbi:eukaryotic translation initiation factor 4 gamma [Anaeramoeba ignava]|uniref:Eukaryotic translation initiation factor 4 gamma n=1 Tax=Anaeramoeba ignava TaxID=1746090 RepID=A0A9Q0R669_ANAIG|nr:eukaryotic translation initiation factor 4 gamma [Anaeramoeba ignava]
MRGNQSPVIQHIPRGIEKLIDFKVVLKANNPWKSNPDDEFDYEKENDIEAKIMEFRSLLNKLARQNFQKILNSFLDIPIENLQELNRVIDLFFQKAIEEEFYSDLYSDFASSLNQNYKLAFQDPKKKDNKTNFKKQLLRKCQSLYKKSVNSFKKDDSDLTDEKKKKIRREALGNAKFIGELYRNELIKSNIMYKCLDELFQDVQDDSIETACKLLITVGSKLLRDAQKELAKNKGIREKKKPKSVYKYNLTVESLSKSKKLTPRIKFKLMDVKDLFNGEWKQPTKLNQSTPNLRLWKRPTKQKPEVFQQQSQTDQEMRELISNFKEKDRSLISNFPNIIQKLTFPRIFCSFCECIFDSKEVGELIDFYFELISESKEIIKQTSNQAIQDQSKNLKNLIIDSPKAHEWFADIIRDMILEEFVEASIISEILKIFDSSKILETKIPSFIEILLDIEEKEKQDLFNSCIPDKFKN